MSSKPGVEQTVEWVSRLKTAVQEFAAREEALEKEFRLRLGKEKQQESESTTAEANQLETRLAENDAAYQSAKASAEGLHEKRKVRITRARTTSKEQTLVRIEKRTGSHKYELQKRLMQTERDRDESLQSAAAAQEELRNQLAAEQEDLWVLENKARGAFGGYGKFRRRLAHAAGKASVNLERDDQQLLGDLREALKQSREELSRFRRQPLPLLFRILPLWLSLPLCLLPMLPFLPGQFAIKFFMVMNKLPAAGALSAALAAGVLVVHWLGGRMAGPAAERLFGALGKAKRLHDGCFEAADKHYQQATARIKREFGENTERIDLDLKSAIKENLDSKGKFRESIDDKTVRVTARNDAHRKSRLARLQRDHAETSARLRREAVERIDGFRRAIQEKESRLNAELASRWEAMQAEWKSRVDPVYEAVAAANAEAAKLFPPWDAKMVEQWKPPAKFEHAAKFGSLEVDVEKLCDAIPKDPRLALPGPAKFSAPLVLTYPKEGSVLFEMANSAREMMIGALNNVILRLLMAAPAGRLNFTVIDPVGLGQNFAGVMHLADYEAQLINSRIWTQPAQIEQKLADLNEHMEKVIQMYLRNEYATIAEYNEQAGNIAEKYHFLVVADFPANFTDQAVKRLLSIAASGARCGVYTLIHWDQRQPMPQDFVPKDLRKSCVCVTAKGSEVVLTGKFMPGTNVKLDPEPGPELATDLVHRIGKASRDSSRVEVPFEHVAPPANEVWSLDTTSELRVPIGRTGATKLQYLAIGKGTRQHALVAGKTGSGKSTLFHVIITNLALWGSPEQVEFYLVDFKKGVEFKCYATNRLPHARVVAIESDREFALSVLQRVDDELKRRGDLFRKLGAQDIAGYKRAGGKEPMPRSLLMIDEFQEYFVEDDKISQTASVLLDRIVRQGRAFGIHVLLGSQTLGGAYTLARTTLGQMVIRVALQCNEADAYLIMDENNPAPRLLSRPGEGIYNDTAGSVEGNSPFQVVWLADELRDGYLQKVRERANAETPSYTGPVVFEGNAPADVRENEVLQAALAKRAEKPPVGARIWLGAPNSIKGPTEAVFHRQSGNHLLIVGQREEAAMAIMGTAIISLAAQYPKGGVRLVVFDGNAPGTPQREFMERVAAAIPQGVTLVKLNEVTTELDALAAELKRRMDGASVDPAEIFVLLHGLQKFNKLRHEEDFSFSSEEKAANPSAQLNQLITEGGSHGMHVLASVDTYNNVNRYLSRKALTEFEMRVLFQMSANDSASLIDNPRASTLGLHRALFFNEMEGYTEVFRPYAVPELEWVEQVKGKLAGTG